MISTKKSDYPIWAITSYYNPVGYKTKLLNYRLFKKNLEIPLVTVELSKDNEFQLNSNDADVLVQVKSNSVLWHKERLLNIALKHIPKEVKYVAWLDCDIIFGNRSSWFIDACEKLKDNNLIQLYSRLYDIFPENLPVNKDLLKLSCLSMTYEKHLLSNGAKSKELNEKKIRSGNGIAWAAKKEIIQSVGFYDGLILGSGDRALIYAAYGDFKNPIDFIRMTNNEKRRNHYEKWAKKFEKLIDGKIGFLENDVYHLWHGKLGNRKYYTRHDEFSKYDFDPENDVHLNEYGCFEWDTNKTELIKYVENYFTARNEDEKVDMEKMIELKRK